MINLQCVTDRVYTEENKKKTQRYISHVVNATTAGMFVLEDEVIERVLSNNNAILSCQADWNIKLYLKLFCKYNLGDRTVVDYLHTCVQDANLNILNN